MSLDVGESIGENRLYHQPVLNFELKFEQYTVFFLRRTNLKTISSTHWESCVWTGPVVSVDTSVGPVEVF